MAQEIKIRIAGKEFKMSAPTPEIEELIRLGAEKVTADVDTYVSRYPGKEMTDILSFVALNEAVACISQGRRLSEARSEAASLAKETEDYIAKNIGK